MRAYQGVKNVNFRENFVYARNELSLPGYVLQRNSCPGKFFCIRQYVQIKYLESTFTLTTHLLKQKYSELSQASKMEVSVKIANDFCEKFQKSGLHKPE